MSHLDSHIRSDPKIKSAIVAVLYESVLIAAGGSIGNYWYNFCGFLLSTEDIVETRA